MVGCASTSRLVACRNLSGVWLYLSHYQPPDKFTTGSSLTLLLVLHRYSMSSEVLSVKASNLKERADRVSLGDIVFGYV